MFVLSKSQGVSRVLFGRLSGLPSLQTTFMHSFALRYYLSFSPFVIDFSPNFSTFARDISFSPCATPESWQQCQSSKGLPLSQLPQHGGGAPKGRVHGPPQPATTPLHSPPAPMFPETMGHNSPHLPRKFWPRGLKHPYRFLLRGLPCFQYLQWQPWSQDHCTGKGKLRTASPLPLPQQRRGLLSRDPLLASLVLRGSQCYVPFKRAFRRPIQLPIKPLL